MYLTPNKHESTLIWLHGLGDTADGFLPIFLDPTIDPTPFTTKVVLPTASTKPVTINNHMSMPSWYDIYSLDICPNTYCKPYDIQ